MAYCQERSAMNATNEPNNNFSKELKAKFRLLTEFGIKTDSIPNGYFANIRSQRDLDLRAKELIAMKLMMS